MSLLNPTEGGMLADLRPDTPDTLPKAQPGFMDLSGLSPVDEEELRAQKVRDQAAMTLRLSKDVPTQQAAQAVEHSKRLGVTPDLAFLAPADMKVRQEESDFLAATAGAPSTQSFLGQSRFNYAAARDDIPNLAAIEQKLTDLSGIFSRSSRGEPDPVNTATGMDWVLQAGARSWQKGLRENEVAKLREGASGPFGNKSLDALADTLNRNAPKDIEVKGFAQTGYTEAVKMSTQQIFMAEEALRWANIGMGMGLIAGGVVGTTGGPLAPGTVPAGSLAGGALGATIGRDVGIFNASRIMEAGSARDEMLQIRDDQGRKLDPLTVDIASSLVGVVNGAIEYAQVRTLTKWVPGLDGLVVKKAVTEAFKNALRSPSVVGTLRKVGWHLFKDISKETAQEIGQEITNVVAEETMKVLGGPGFERAAPEEIAARLAETAYSSFASFTFMQAPGASWHAGKSIYRERKISVASQKANTLMQDLSAIGAESTTAKRSTGVWEDFYNHLAQQIDGAPEKVYVSSEALLKAADGLAGVEQKAPAAGEAQAPARPGSSPEAQVALDQILGTMGITREQFDRDSQTSGDVAVPFTLFQSKVASTPLGVSLLGDIKLDPLHHTANEQAQHDKDHEDKVTYYQTKYLEDKDAHEADFQAALAPFYDELAKLGIRGSVADTQLKTLVAGAQWVAKNQSAIQGKVVSPAEVLRDHWKGLGLEVVEAPKNVDPSSFVKDAGLKAKITDTVQGTAVDPLTGELLVNPAAPATQEHLTGAAETAGQYVPLDLSSTNVKVMLPHEGRVADMNAREAITQTTELAQKLDDLLNCLG